ncbi:hypothetical protein BB934_45465 (plasmid) [Microvirga ossetica]|uniref:Uncharacterized protein n=1 Tax=Microvirga ossetica TaxID=1882682 RepID=A0A1B2EZS0_9HYPH|nr:hypothetical protein [Microvirga ossetica]ANY85471.1 hypothetical protein BB934_45465 [Microvirga ossetica]
MTIAAHTVSRPTTRKVIRQVPQQKGVMQAVGEAYIKTILKVALGLGVLFLLLAQTKLVFDVVSVFFPGLMLAGIGMAIRGEGGLLRNFFGLPVVGLGTLLMVYAFVNPLTGRGIDYFIYASGFDRFVYSFF